MNIFKNKEGVVFVVVLIYIVLGLLLIGGYLNMTSREYRITKLTNDTIKAFYQAEAGANRGLAELKKRCQSDMVTRLRAVSLDLNSTIRNYAVNNEHLLFLHDYACQSGAPESDRFQIPQSGTAILTIPSVTGFNYNGQITVKPNGSASFDDINHIYTFPYSYDTIYATVTAGAVTKKVALRGTFTITVFPQSFASYALFTNQQKTASGTDVWFTNNTNFRGPVHTNGRFNFALNPSGTFTGLVTQHEQTAKFYNNGSPIPLDADHNGTKDVPTFQAGFTRGYGTISMPTTVSKDTQRRRALGLADADPIPTKANGIYVPNSGGAVTGGIYLQGNSTVATSVSGNNAIYTVTQGTTTQNITVNNTTNQTTVQTVGGGTSTYNGKPNGMIFVNEGNITSLSGTVQKDSQVTIANSAPTGETRDIIFSDDVKYENYTSGPPPVFRWQPRMS